MEIKLPIEKLAEYEILEKQKKLKIFPCAIGDTVYVLTKCEDILPEPDETDKDRDSGIAAGYHCPYMDDCPFDNKNFEDCEKYRKITAVFKDMVNRICIFKDDTVHIFTEKCATLGIFGKDIFLTQEAAEAERSK